MTMKSFLEDENTAVFTTKFVMKDRELITYVTHEIEDGAWQFYSESEFNGYEDIMVVSLKNIIELDETITKIADLPLGFAAFRKTKTEEWKIEQL